MGFNSIFGPQSFDFFLMQAKYSQIFEFQQDLVQMWFVNYVGCWQLARPKFQLKSLMFSSYRHEDLDLSFITFHYAKTLFSGLHS